jgi:hypothetical protein
MNVSNLWRGGHSWERRPATVWYHPFGSTLPKGSPDPSMTDPKAPGATPAFGARCPAASSLCPSPAGVESSASKWQRLPPLRRFTARLRPPKGSLAGPPRADSATAR